MVLRRIHWEAIEAMAMSSGTFEEISGKVGVSSRTLQRWRKDASFREALARRMKLRPQAFLGMGVWMTYRLLGHLVARIETGGETVPAKEILALVTKLLRDFSPTPEDRRFELTPVGAHKCWETGRRALVEGYRSARGVSGTSAVDDLLAGFGLSEGEVPGGPLAPAGAGDPAGKVSPGA